jgi:hypothetical protein
VNPAWLALGLGVLMPGTGDQGAGGTEPGLAGRSDILFSCDFEDENWWRAWGETRPPQNTELVGGEAAFSGKGRSLKVSIPRGQHYGTSFAFRTRQKLGAEPEEIFFRYHLKFDPDWRNATFGGKLPGFDGTYGRAGWGGRPVNGRDGWSARGLFHSRAGGNSTAVGFYGYHADMRGQYGSEWEFKPSLEHGRWYGVEMHVRLNTPAGPGEAKGRNDGILRGWIDGQPAFEKTDVRFRDVDTLKIEAVWVNVYHGGATQTPQEDIRLYLDNMVIAKGPIGPARMKASVVEKPPGSGLPSSSPPGEKVAELSPDEKAARKLVEEGEKFLREGDLPAAKAFFERVRDLFPGTKSAERAMDHLGRMK